MEGYWFKSTLFDVEPGEDKETNPQCYGKQLAKWVHKKIPAFGYTVDEVFPEDWGWCVVCSNDRYLLWIGCSSVRDAEYPDDVEVIPQADEIVWHCFPVLELPFFYFRSNVKKLLGKLDVKTPLEKLDRQLLTALREESQIEIIENYCGK